MGSACAALLQRVGVAGEPITVSSSVLSCVSNRTFDSLASRQYSHVGYSGMAPRRGRGGGGSDRHRRPGRSRARSEHERHHYRYHHYHHHRRHGSDLASVHSSVDNMRRIYKKIKSGMRKSVPAAIVLYPFHKIRTKNGLTSRRVIKFLRQHYRLQGRPAGKTIGSMLRCAVEFGLLCKRGNKYFLPTQSKNSKIPW